MCRTRTEVQEEHRVAQGWNSCYNQPPLSLPVLKSGRVNISYLDLGKRHDDLTLLLLFCYCRECSQLSYKDRRSGNT